ncbi:MAG: L,D-transpeptidase Cds6 family protein [Burkholderiales bacterium]
MVIARQVEWVSPGALRAEREAFLRWFEQWRADWESGEAERYLAHYARDFRSGGMDLAEWRAHKRRVGAAKSWITVAVDNVSLYRDPGQHDMIVATFDQDYGSSNFSGRSRKRQYWIREENAWKIAYEAQVESPKLLLPESFAAGLSRRNR